MFCESGTKIYMRKTCPRIIEWEESLVPWWHQQYHRVILKGKRLQKTLYCWWFGNNLKKEKRILQEQKRIYYSLSMAGKPFIRYSLRHYFFERWWLFACWRSLKHVFSGWRLTNTNDQWEAIKAQSINSAYLSSMLDIGLPNVSP